MRKNQLSITLERFGDQSRNGHGERFVIYSDGNGLPEVIDAALEKLRVEYYPQLGREEFYAMLISADNTTPRIGVCETHFSEK